MRWVWMVWMAAWGLGVWGSVARGDLREETRFLMAGADGTTDRSAGSEGARRSRERLVERAEGIARAGGGKVLRQGFMLTVPVVEECRVEEGGGGRVKVDPLLPMGGVPVVVGEKGKEVELEVVYGGDGSLSALKGKEMVGKLVALEMKGGAGGGGWQRCAGLGAAGIVFLGDEGTENGDFLRRYTTLPLGLPRFYCDDAGVTGRIRTGELKRLKMEVRTGWEERRAENVVLVLPGKGGGGGGGWAEQWVILQARYDGASQVMGRSPGATQAMDAAVLEGLAEKIAGMREHCGVVCVWTAGDEWNYRGTRAFLDVVQRGLRDPAKGPMVLQRKVVDAEQALQVSKEVLAGVERVAEDGWVAERLRGGGGGGSGGARGAIEEELLRETSRVEEELEAARLRGGVTGGTGGDGGGNGIEELKRKKQELMVAGSLVTGRYVPAAGESVEGEKEKIVGAAKEILGRWKRDVERRGAEVEALRNWPEIRGAMPGRDPLLWISVALTGGTAGEGEGGPPRIGLSARSAYSVGLDVTGRMAGYGQAFRRYAGRDNVGGVYVPEALETGSTLETYFAMGSGVSFSADVQGGAFPSSGGVGFSSDAAIARGMPAVAAATLLDRAGRVDTPGDLEERMAWDKVEVEARALERLLLGNGNAGTGALVDPRLYVRTDLPAVESDQEVTLFERAVGETLPRLKAAEALIGGESEIYGHPLGGALVGTRRQEWYLTHADGTVRFESVNRVQDAEMRLQAFTFDGGGRVRQALLDKEGDVQGMVASFSPAADRPVRAMLFDARPLECFGLFDPRYLDRLDQIQLLDAKRQDAVELSSVYAREGMAAVFLPARAQGGGAVAWQLLASRGNVGKRMILINADREEPRGRGFATTERAAIGPLPWRAARDFYFLNAQRKANLEKFGISNEVIRELQGSSDRQLAAGEAAERRRDDPAFFAAADALWSLQSQEYQNLIATSNGIIKGVIFLLLGVIPFSYFLERLLIGSPSVYRQIAWFAAIFVAMTAGLWFHPAFRISSAPLMILLAFLILILSSTVVYILWGKFEDEIARIRGTGSGAGGGSHVQSFRRGAVLGAAVRLGLSNMRRRGMRTGLTLLTLVLLTFTLLCFTSVRESVQVSPRPVAWPAGVPRPGAGILLRQREWRELPEETVTLAEELSLPVPVALGETTGAGAGGKGEGMIARRYWYASERKEQSWKVPVVGKEERPPYYLGGLVGLDAAEAEFQGAGVVEDVLPGFGKKGNEERCWLPEQARGMLGVAAGEKVHLLGRELEVGGFFDAAGFAKLRELSGDPLTPTEQRSSPGGNGGGGGGGDESLQPEGTYRYLDPVAVAVVPASMLERLGARLTSVMVRPAGVDARGGEGIDALAAALARRSAFSVYASDGSRVEVINAAEASRPQDLGTVLVPMLIAGVIVLNTMLGAVSERTREIHVYTSVGLSPAHVGMLFLAEAAALGTLGVVFGYIFGQGLATLLSWTRLLPGVDLNYSSMSAIVTMGLVLGLVMVSALWPARSASRLASPSLQRDWKLPRPVGDLLAVDLPFTVNETAARGVCAFLAEYLQSTSQAGTGRFTADNIHGFVQATTFGPGAEVRGLVARIWLAPYDLGVIQTMELGIHPTDQPGVFDVHVELTREAGNPATWRRLNRPFLVEIRKQFLLWRAVEAGRVAEYVRKSEALFGGGQ